jgi:hypothetical protein
LKIFEKYFFELFAKKYYEWYPRILRISLSLCIGLKRLQPTYIVEKI